MPIHIFFLYMKYSWVIWKLWIMLVWVRVQLKLKWFLVDPRPLISLWTQCSHVSCGVWKRLLVPPSPFSTYFLWIKPLLFIWARGCPRWRLHFLSSLAAGCGQVIQFWTMGPKWQLCMTTSGLPWAREINHYYPAFHHLPASHWINGPGRWQESEFFVIRYNENKGPERELCLSLEHNDSPEPSPANPFSIETTYV